MYKKYYTVGILPVRSGIETHYTATEYHRLIIMSFESKLIPVMREGVEVVKMIFFKKLHASLAGEYPEWDAKFSSMVTGAIVNQTFGTTNDQEPFLSFNEENRELINKEAGNVASRLEEMRIPLTDALRMQSLCDQMDEVEGKSYLKTAQEAGILIDERDLPMPNSFMDMVRRMGKAFGLIIPPLPEEEVSSDTTQ